jgi:uncharacterized protein (TIGR00251 family)
MAGVPDRDDSHGVVVVSGGVRFAVYVQPRASRSEVVGMHGDAFKIRLAAPPVDGAANEALVELLARKLGKPKAAVRIVSGERSRRKVVVVEGGSVEGVQQGLMGSS